MITFKPESHTYWDENGKEYISVTTLISREFPFKENEIAEKVSKIHSSRYHGMSINRILKMWDDSSGHGNDVHSAIENYIKYKTFPDNPSIIPLVEQFSKLNFRGSLMSEVLIHDEQYLIAGMVDILECFNDYIYIWDIKTSNNISDDKLMKFSMQLELYKRIVEKQFIKPVKGCGILHFKDYVVKRSKTKLNIFEPLNVSSSIDEILNKRLLELNEKRNQDKVY